MSDYTIDEACFSLPSGWHDRSLNVLGPEPSNNEFKVLVSRNDQNRRTLDDFVDGQIKEFSQRMPWFDIKSRSECMVAGIRGIEVRATFRDGIMEMYQHQVTFPVQGKFVTITAASLERVANACTGEVMRLLSTVRTKPVSNEIP